MRQVIRVFLLNALISICCLILACGAVHAEGLLQMREAFGRADFTEVIRIYATLTPEEQSRAMPQFMVGNSYMRHHDFRHAEPYLKNALNLNLPAKQRELCTDTLRRIQTLKALVPKFLLSRKSGGMIINIYAADDDWSRSICAQLPIFLARANEAFPGESATVNFYMFENHDTYDHFYKSWTHKENPDSDTKHRGTGGYEMVEFCRYFPNGTRVGAKNINDLYLRVLHEYSHALCATIYGDQFGFRVPQWLNESMADYFGWKFRPELVPQQGPLLAGLAKKYPPPTYEDECRRFYEGPFGYTFGDNILIELMKGKPLSTYRQILNNAKARNGDFDASLRDVIGKDPKVVHQEIVNRYWSLVPRAPASAPAKAN